MHGQVKQFLETLIDHKLKLETVCFQADWQPQGQPENSSQLSVSHPGTSQPHVDRPTVYTSGLSEVGLCTSFKFNGGGWSQTAMQHQKLRQPTLTLFHLSQTILLSQWLWSARFSGSSLIMVMATLRRRPQDLAFCFPCAASCLIILKNNWLQSALCLKQDKLEETCSWKVIQCCLTYQDIRSRLSQQHLNRYTAVVHFITPPISHLNWSITSDKRSLLKSFGMRVKRHWLSSHAYF